MTTQWVLAGGGSASVAMSAITSSGCTATLTVPDGSTLVSWTLQYRKTPSTTWLNYATGITGTAQAVTGLDSSSTYEFRGSAVRMDSATGVVTATTAPYVPPAVPLTLWSQIEGGQDYGNVVTGGSISDWNTSVDFTTQANPRNDEAESIVAAQLIYENASSLTPTTLKGWAVQSGGVWNIDRTTYQLPSGGSQESPKIMLTSEIALSTPLASGQRMLLQQLNSPGPVTYGKSLGSNQFPASGLINAQRCGTGDLLGGSPGSITYGPWASRVYLKRASNPHYVFVAFGDSTVAQVRPTAATASIAKEGWNFRANGSLRSSSKKVRIYSYGQGAASWSQILNRVRANLPTLAGKVTRILVQVWTWNSAWSNSGQVDTAWAQYLVLQAECETAGIPCSPLILHPYTTRTSTGQPEAFARMKDYAVAHGKGLVLDTIFGDTSWPNLPASESEDNVHQNGAGSIRTASAIAAAALALAVSDVPELA